MTNKQFVKSIYPNAEIYKHRYQLIYVVWDGIRLALSTYEKSSKLAWKDAANKLRNTIAERLSK